MNNQVNLSVKDFQIIKGANLSFLPGLNCIIGQSNNGKSALMRAAKACIYNEAGTTSVRIGQSNYAVGLQMNGHTVILQKGSNSLYKIDGELYGKIGRTQLEEVAKALGIKELSINGSTETINFWDQMEKPFLLDRSETELFRFIVDSGKDNNVTSALKSITQDRQQITKDISMVEGRIAQIDSTIKAQEAQLENADEKLAVYNRVIELGPKITRLNEMTQLKNKSIEENKMFKALVIANTKNNMLIDKVTPNIDKINVLIKKQDLVSMISNNIKSNTSKIEELNKELSKMKSLDVSDLNENFTKYKLLTELITNIRSNSNEMWELCNLNFPTLSDSFESNIEKYKQISELIEDINLNQKLINENKENHNKIVEELNKVQEEINSVGICPTCGQPLHN